MITKLLNTFDLFFPRTCLGCRRPLQQAAICLKCSIDRNTSDTPFLGYYEGRLKALIKEAKFRPSPALMHLLAEQFSTIFQSTDQKWDLIVPIPPSSTTYRKRLFHQTWILAKAAQRRLSYKIEINECLKLAKPHKQQASLRRAERISNMEGAFVVRTSVLRKRILLIDDVITTGATVFSAKQALIEAGADTIDIYCLARSRNYERFKGRIHQSFGV